LPFLPEALQTRMNEALRVFEKRAAPTLYSLDDITSGEEDDLTEEEARRALHQVILGFEMGESDWMRIHDGVVRVVSDRKLAQPKA